MIKVPTHVDLVVDYIEKHGSGAEFEAHPRRPIYRQWQRWVVWSLVEGRPDLTSLAWADNPKVLAWDGTAKGYHRYETKAEREAFEAAHAPKWTPVFGLTRDELARGQNRPVFREGCGNRRFLCPGPNTPNGAQYAFADAPSVSATLGTEVFRFETVAEVQSALDAFVKAFSRNPGATLTLTATKKET